MPVAQHAPTIDPSPNAVALLSCLLHFQLCSIMSGSLPAVEELAEDQLPELAQLHMSSAGNLRHTMHQLAPDSSAGHSCTTPDRGMLNELNEAQSGAVAVLIELQLFHLHRASALLAHHRAMRVLQEERQSSTPA